MKERLILDVGMHKGQDTAYYLGKGYHVVAIDADGALIARARKVFSEYVNNGQLTLVNCAVSEHDGEVEFHISKNTGFSSLRRPLSDRHGLFKETVKVQSRTLPGLMREYGVPFYCKIDIEGHDEICLRTLEGLDSLPQYISVETECIGESETLSEEQALGTLNQLHKLGYRRFKLVDQSTSRVLDPRVQFYRNTALGNIVGVIRKNSFLMGIIRRNLLGVVERVKKTNGEIPSSKQGYKFPFGSTGPFGDDLQGEWLDYEKARQTLLFHRRDYFAVKSSPVGFWCDWHAGL